ncbi:hypothetical protein [Phreatobacter sp.]|uniref:hypothetical protein n=1 Tax=Phreatobacter sp. TaxID=1966341 RepID=UPI0022C7086A|nr:hypothetical protein [Phreatobacter sp.]MCZ8313422.1 hypothetical protein [Phreatobacter sp.]
MTTALAAGLACLGALALAPASAHAQWRVREVQEAHGAPALEIIYRSSGERLTLLCSAGSAFVSFAPGYRLPASDALVEGHYSVDGRPAKTVRWQMTRNSAFITAGFATSFVADITGASQLSIAFPAVEQTYDLSPLRPHAARLRAICGSAS